MTHQQATTRSAKKDAIDVGFFLCVLLMGIFVGLVAMPLAWGTPSETKASYSCEQDGGQWITGRSAHLVGRSPHCQW